MVDLDMVKEAGLFEAFDVFVAKTIDDDYEIYERALEMALNDCKTKHNGCNNCTRKCAWRE